MTDQDISRSEKPHEVTNGHKHIIQSDPEPNIKDFAIDADAQPGVQKIEAVTVTWTTTALVLAYVIIWITYFVEGLLANVTGALSPFVTSAFALHSLTPTVGVLSSVIGGVTNLTIVKILDVFGRPQGYLFCIILGTVGLIMMAACRSVEAYAAAQVFYTVGNNGIQYSLGVFVADTSSLRNRALMQSFAQSANLITCWLGGPMAEAYLKGPGWQWCFGTFSILVPAITLPLFGLLAFHQSKAKKQGLVPRRETQRTIWQSFAYYCREFDAIGLLLLSGGVALFLLPFNLYTLQTKGWGSPLIICFLVFGIVLIVAFVAWERFFAPVTFIPYSLLLDRTVLGSCLLSATIFLSYLVVNGLSVSHASYIIQIYTVVSVLVCIATGTLIHYTGRFKPICLYVGIPLSILGMGLLIHFRQANGHIGYIIMCQFFISIAAGIIIITASISGMAAASHQHVAVVIAILSMFGSIGGAIGLTIASAIWQNTLPKKLLEYLPADELPNLITIYADITTQLSYPIGSPTRVAIQRAYGDAQFGLLTTGTVVWVIEFVAVIMWRDINVIGMKQTKGHVV
ncbi:hypothetical protein B0J11DRAFT_599433 [Dendryphion nanum]|uniref:Major facilitator superfamily (MFS) profile domain-containing protein n=1 Tax=Dendryphion nanum TaxID=256645 RepID=A0A9P9D0Q8_9PLEO|nr:hypothetical protein B0J11DRAFT_599433 [Dendryphion nanum]